MAIQRRNKSVKSKRYKSAGLLFIVIIAVFSVVAGFADEWLSRSGEIRVIVQGNAITSEALIQKLAAIPDSSSIGTLDLLRIEENVVKSPFVKSAVVTTRPPHTVVIAVTERTPFAVLVNYNQKDWLVDEEGVIMPPMTRRRNLDLPVISGERLAGERMAEGAKVENEGIQNALAILREAQQINTVRAALISEVHVRMGNDMVLYTTDGSIPVIFGNLSRSYQKLSALFAFLSNEKVCAEMSELAYIDLRFKDQLVANWDNSSHSNGQDGNIAASVTSSN